MIWSAASRMVRPSSSIAPLRRTPPLGVFLVIDRVAAGRAQLQVPQQGVGIGNGALGPDRHAGLERQGPGLLGWERGEERLPADVQCGYSRLPR